MTNDNTQYPANWRIAADFDPNQHMLSLKGKDYLTVQNRLLWFVRDQRDFITRGLAAMPYIIRTELVEHDRDAGYAQFRTYVRDVLGNEATMYGSETAKDFGDYAEKASTKSLGRALAMLGYGTAAAPEMDEGERVVDSPVERRQSQHPNNAPHRAPQPHTAAHPKHVPASASDAPAASSGHGIQDTPVATSTVDPMALTHASAKDQHALVEALRAAGYTTQPGVENLLLHVTGRAIPAADLLREASDISYAELAKAHQYLTRVPTANGHSGKGTH